MVSALGVIVVGRLIDTPGYGPAFASCVVALLAAAVIIIAPTGTPKSTASIKHR